MRLYIDVYTYMDSGSDGYGLHCISPVFCCCWCCCCCCWRRTAVATTYCYDLLLVHLMDICAYIHMRIYIDAYRSIWPTAASRWSVAIPVVFVSALLAS